MKFLQTLKLVQVDGVDVEHLDEHSDEDIHTEDIVMVSEEYEPTSDTETSQDQAPVKPEVKKKRGRKPLTTEERIISRILRTAYFKKYYKEHPEKYPYEKYGFDNSCVYKLYCSKNDRVYIGSTILPLTMRKARHMSSIKTKKNLTYTEMADVSTIADEWIIEPIIKVPLSNKKQLDALESIYISSWSTPLYNKKKKYSMEVVKELAQHLPVNILPKSIQDVLQVSDTKK